MGDAAGVAGIKANIYVGGNPPYYPLQKEERLDADCFVVMSPRNDRDELNFFAAYS